MGQPSDFDELREDDDEVDQSASLTLSDGEDSSSSTDEDVEAETSTVPDTRLCEIKGWFLQRPISNGVRLIRYEI